jgi:hypothetical protein
MPVAAAVDAASGLEELAPSGAPASSHAGGGGSGAEAVDLVAALAAQGALDDEAVQALRTIRYEFPADVLRMPVISTTCVARGHGRGRVVHGAGGDA